MITFEEELEELNGIKTKVVINNWYAMSRKRKFVVGWGTEGGRGV